VRFSALLVATIAPFLGGCRGACPELLQPFTVEKTLSARAGQPAAELSCHALCRTLPLTGEPWGRIERIDACTHTVHVWDGEPRPGFSPAAYMVDIRCSGVVEQKCKGGRRPLGHVEAAVGEGLPAHLAGCAHLEAASVLAFRELAGQLGELYAPASLIRRCMRAAEDEVRHAAVLGALARARGAHVPAIEARSVGPSLEKIAAHNAVEGCVHEAWAAVEAAWQAMHAHEPELRAAFAGIAVDEAEHAQLAWDLHAWFLGRLSPAARTNVSARQRTAIARLPRCAAATTPYELGMPPPEVVTAMATNFAAGLSAAA